MGPFFRLTGCINNWLIEAEHPYGNVIGIESLALIRRATITDIDDFDHEKRVWIYSPGEWPALYGACVSIKVQRVIVSIHSRVRFTRIDQLCR